MLKGAAPAPSPTTKSHPPLPRAPIILPPIFLYIPSRYGRHIFSWSIWGISVSCNIFHWYKMEYQAHTVDGWTLVRPQNCQSIIIYYIHPIFSRVFIPIFGWPRVLAIRYEDFARLFGPHFALQALRFRVHLAKTSRTIPATRSRHPWTWDTTRGSFSQSLWNLLNTKSTQKRSFVSNTSFWHILMYMMYQTQKCSDIYIYDMRYVSSPRHLLTTRNALQKRNSAKSGAELGGCIKPYEILAWQWLWGNVGQHWAGAANQVKLELSRTVIQYCKNYAKTMMIYLRRGRSNNDVSKLFATFFLRSGLGNMCPHGRMRFPSSYQAITQWCFFHPKSSWSGQQRSCRSQLEYFSTAWISHGFPEGSSTKLPFWVAVLLNGDVGSNLSK